MCMYGTLVLFLATLLRKLLSGREVVRCGAGLMPVANEERREKRNPESIVAL